jgi:hypothetical protein
LEVKEKNGVEMCLPAGLPAEAILQASHQRLEADQLDRAAGLAAGDGPVRGDSHGGDEQAAGPGGERSAALFVEERKAGGPLAESVGRQQLAQVERLGWFATGQRCSTWWVHEWVHRP